MDQRSRFQVVEETPPTFEQAFQTPQPTPSPAVSIGATALAIGLKALSQRALVALSASFTLLTVASVWWLWASIPDPSPTQIVSLSIYAAFILAANVIVRRLK